ncbi:MAG: DNA internalization-related competence protein ComEC/Rec2 [Nitrospirae bacterium]|nr:DNA internalization-related competence protein ComEC/Rec2 [Nitrospirota bacterium]
MQRPVVQITIFYILGIAAAELFYYFPAGTTVITILFLIFACVINRKAGKPMHAALPLMVMAFSAGFSYTLLAGILPPDDISGHANGDKVTITGTVDEPVIHYPQRIAAILTASAIQHGNSIMPASGRVRLTVYDTAAGLDYGDEIRFTARLKRVRGFKNPGLFNYAGYLSRKGIRATASPGKKDWLIKTGEYGNPVLKKIFGWRENIRVSIKQGLSDHSSAVLQAMIIGTTGDLTPEIRDKFTAAGVTHILSISGSHLGFVTFLIFFITRYLLTHLPYRLFLRITLYTTPSKISAIVTIPLIILYSFLSGGEVATIRSLIMAIVFLLAIVIERDDDPISTLAIAALIVLIRDPQGLFDISFQLSYTAVLAMIITVRIFHDTGGKGGVAKGPAEWRRKFVLLLILTVSAAASTTPIVSHYFNQLTWTGLLSNLILIPYAGLTVIPVGLASGCIGLIFNRAVLPFETLNEILVMVFLKMVDFFASLPFAVIHTPSPHIILVILLYLFLISLSYLKKRWAKITTVISISLIAAAICCRLSGSYDNKTLRISFLDVGQGDSALIEFPGSKIMLIDGGGTFSNTLDTGRSVIAPYLWNKGIRTVDYMVLSHPQTDHAGGLIYILDTFKVGEVWTNGMTSPATFLFDRRIRDQGIRHLSVSSNPVAKTIDGCSVSVLNPPSHMSGHRISNSGMINDLSVVMRIACGNSAVLFTGDTGAERLRDIAASNAGLRSSILKVPHHGARGSVDAKFISSVKPAAAIISAGYQNSYRHPSPEAISAYRHAGSAIYRTDLDGAITVITYSGKPLVRTYQDTLLKKASFDSLTTITDTEINNLKMVMEEFCNGGI